MTTPIRPRLRLPALYLLAGTAFAAAWIVHGHGTWWISILTEVSVAVWVTRTYLRAGQDTDEGALAGSRADERLRLLRTRSRALAGTVAIIAAFIGLTAAVAARAGWWWPFALMLGLMLLAYLFGWSEYGIGAADPAEEEAAAATTARPATAR
jgi:hypothetical protein